MILEDILGMGILILGVVVMALFLLVVLVLGIVIFILFLQNYL